MELLIEMYVQNTERTVVLNNNERKSLGKRVLYNPVLYVGFVGYI